MYNELKPYLRAYVAAIEIQQIKQKSAKSKSGFLPPYF